MKFNEIFLTTTDTVAGIGAPMNDANLEALYFLKNRPLSKKMIIMVGNMEQARQFKEWSDKAEKLAKENWPGNVTLALTEEIALRMPGVEGLRKVIIDKGPVYMTSANKSGEDQLTLDEAKKVFKEVTEYYNFGEGSGNPSTIIRVEDGKVLR